jgi:hypothetical protein
MTTLTSLPVIGAILAALIWWYRRRAIKAAARADAADRAKETAEATVTQHRAADARETAAHVEAEREIPAPTAEDPIEAIAEINAAWKASDARRRADGVRRKIAAGRRRW